MKISHLLYTLIGVSAGLFFAPRAGLGNRYLTRKAKEGQNMIDCSIRRTETVVANTAEDIIDALETGRRKVVA
jgi:gas vesicle protein